MLLVATGQYVRPGDDGRFVSSELRWQIPDRRVFKGESLGDSQNECARAFRGGGDEWKKRKWFLLHRLIVSPLGFVVQWTVLPDNRHRAIRQVALLNLDYEFPGERVLHLSDAASRTYPANSPRQLMQSAGELFQERWTCGEWPKPRITLGQHKRRRPGKEEEKERTESWKAWNRTWDRLYQAWTRYDFAKMTAKSKDDCACLNFLLHSWAQDYDLSIRWTPPGEPTMHLAANGRLRTLVEHEDHQRRLVEAREADRKWKEECKRKKAADISRAALEV